MITRRPEELVAELLELRGRCVVDVGCGEGRLCRFMAGLGASVVGIDPSATLLARARALASAQSDGLQSYVRASGDALPLRTASAEAVVFLNSLHHIPPRRQARALAEAARVVTGGGRVLVIEPLAEGGFFETVRLVDDETEVRAHAYRVIRKARRFGLSQEREVTVSSPVRFPDYAALRERIIAANEGRRAAVEAADTRLEARFLERALRRDDGYHFIQPLRANLLRKRG